MAKNSSSSRPPPPSREPPRPPPGPRSSSGRRRVPRRRTSRSRTPCWRTTTAPSIAAAVGGAHHDTLVSFFAQHADRDAPVVVALTANGNLQRVLRPSTTSASRSAFSSHEKLRSVSRCAPPTSPRCSAPRRAPARVRDARPLLRLLGRRPRPPFQRARAAARGAFGGAGRRRVEDEEESLFNAISLPHRRALKS